MAPHYLQDRLSLCDDPRLRSYQKQLKVPNSRTNYGDRRFSVAGPTLWNMLPLDIRFAPSLEIFKSKLKTHLFDEAYPAL